MYTLEVSMVFLYNFHGQKCTHIITYEQALKAAANYMASSYIEYIKNTELLKKGYCREESVKSLTAQKPLLISIISYCLKSCRVLDNELNDERIHVDDDTDNPWWHVAKEYYKAEAFLKYYKVED